MAGQDFLEKLIEEHMRRLQKLKLRQASEGIYVDASIPNEIENIEKTIADLQEELAEMRKTQDVAPQLNRDIYQRFEDNPYDQEELNLPIPTKKGFVTSGPVDFTSSVYVSRETDDKAFQILSNHDYLTITAPRQMGKTSLLHKLRAQLREAKAGYGYATAYLDFMDGFNRSETDWKDWIRAICRRIQDELSRSSGGKKLSVEIPEAPWHLSSFFANLVKAVQAPGIVILLDEAASVPLNIRNTFYSVLRTMYNQRNTDSIFNRCNFVFAGVFEPDKLVENERNSPFNISEHLKLSDFSQQETRRLIENLKLAHQVEITDELIEAIHYWIGGQPYLTQRLAALLEEGIKANPDILLDDTLVKTLIPRLMDAASSSINYITRNATDSERGLDKWMLKVLNGKSIPSQPANELELIGALKRVGFEYVIRNRIYEIALRQAYAKEELEN